jgi:hypothetical protein
MQKRTLANLTEYCDPLVSIPLRNTSHQPPPTAVPNCHTTRDTQLPTQPIQKGKHTNLSPRPTPSDTRLYGEFHRNTHPRKHFGA